MGPKRSTRPAPYDPELPANWHVSRLKEFLNNRGINFPQTARRSVLIRLVEQESINRTETSARSQSSVQQNNNGGGRELIDIVTKLTSTVQNLQQNVISLTSRVNTLTSTSLSTDVNSRPSEITNTPLPNSTITTPTVNPTVSVTTALDPSSGQNVATTEISNNFNISSAITAMQTSTPRIVSAAAGSEAQLGRPDYTRTRYGYAAESLPLVETISPQLRQQITADGEISMPGPTLRSRAHSLPASFRDVDGLEQAVQDLWDKSLSHSTKQTYSSAFQTFLTFMQMNGVTFLNDGLPPVNETVLVYFVTHCKSVLKLKHDTIKLYLAGIRFHYIRAGYGDILQGCDQLQYVLRGIKRSQMNVHNKRLPITVDILQQLLHVLDKGFFSPFVDLMLKCMFSCAYFGFLRCGEITCKGTNSSEFVQIGDVVMQSDKNAFVLRLKSSKTDPFSRGVDITIYENEHLKPVHIMMSYLEIRKSLPFLVSSPLFVDSEFNLTPILREKFVQLLRQLLLRLGYPVNNFAGHSFRIGAATAAAAAGVEDHVIKELGRWSSNCYIRYIRTNSQVIREAQEKMSGR
ncbi:uncharacterized protein LOC134260042 [Saccostrea cucullata]|uniref:uncharacterized protein LOC134260042 n=1 Tax=Saccostrea cuccullata TaxID=36930 RepID=UPI002ED524A7